MVEFIPINGLTAYITNCKNYMPLLCINRLKYKCVELRKVFQINNKTAEIRISLRVFN